MRAKRAKKYRKIMNTYQLHYSFREPYQVLITSDCLRAIHAFSMPIHQFLENTLHGKVMPYITQCTLGKVMEGYSGKGRDGRPKYLPPPTEVPLRYCKHKDDEGQERGVIPEAECILDLIGGQAKGNEQKKNKQHFVVAAADWDEGIKDAKEKETAAQQRRKRLKMGKPDVDVRDHARVIPGVPIVYVKRSVMILEEPSLATERAIRGVEREKYKDGVGGAARGVKRGREDSEDEDDDEDRAGGAKVRGLQKARGPNPLSVKRKRPKMSADVGQVTTDDGSQPANKSKTKRRRGRRGKGTGQHVDGAENVDAVAVEAESS
ncbi:hypothetical protein H2198_009235 [Neophaeococcomyces mojaviensis]|uniref:Uncharacterized protein n=1 Tax=Neophaeococcomyces mojaviensis TaxID=3383035 RepID=A0ACC2ZV20_9EURO|nr:hypothetical protein H2198_009235 [Knufia sp. JES_112]